MYLWRVSSYKCKSLLSLHYVIYYLNCHLWKFWCIMIKWFTSWMLFTRGLRSAPFLCYHIIYAVNVKQAHSFTFCSIKKWHLLVACNRIELKGLFNVLHSTSCLTGSTVYSGCPVESSRGIEAIFSITWAQDWCLHCECDLFLILFTSC